MTSPHRTKNGILLLPTCIISDDIRNCIVMQEDYKNHMNTRATLNEYVKLLQSTIYKINRVIDMIPDDHKLSVFGLGNHINLSGDGEIIDNLCNDGLLEITDDGKELMNKIPDKQRRNAIFILPTLFRNTHTMEQRSDAKYVSDEDKSPVEPINNELYNVPELSFDMPLLDLNMVEQIEPVHNFIGSGDEIEESNSKNY
jgi:hypothetical protein